jgi:glutamine---fructose-6-phosphate transaminase (isomerizing)
VGYPERFAETLARAVRAGLDLNGLRTALAPAFDALAADSRFPAGGRVLLTGSGDSFFAAQATLPALRRWSGHPVDASSSLQCARYELPLVGPGDAVVAVSNAGNSTRTRETLVLARDRGALTVALTGNRTGPLAALADHVLYRPIGRLEEADPTHGRVWLNMVEYVTTLATLYLWGLHLGRLSHRLSAAEVAAWDAALEAAVAAIGPAAAAVEPSVAALADELAGIDTLWVLGAGPNRGTAEYAAAKLHEQLPRNGIAQDLEEWAHREYFLTLGWRERAVVLVLAPPGNSLDRAEELVEGIAGAGGRAIVVGQAGMGRTPKAWARLDLPAETPELLTPLTYHVPAQLLVMHLARRAGLPSVPLRRADDYWLIRKGAVRETARGLT